MTLPELELEKKAVLARIATHRTVMRGQVAQVRRSFSPMTAAAFVFRTILPLFRPLSGLARSVKKGRKRGIGTWFRVGLVAATLVPAVRALWDGHDDAD